MLIFYELVNFELILGQFGPLLYVNFSLRSANAKKSVKVVISVKSGCY